MAAAKSPPSEIAMMVKLAKARYGLMDFSCTLRPASASRALLSRVPLGKQPGPQASQDQSCKAPAIALLQEIAHLEGRSGGHVAPQVGPSRGPTSGLEGGLR